VRARRGVAGTRLLGRRAIGADQEHHKRNTKNANPSSLHRAILSRETFREVIHYCKAGASLTQDYTTVITAIKETLC
jgi:hypothetical protein